MIPSTLVALVVALSSVVNGAVIQRDGTFTYLTPQPTAPGQAAGTTTTTTTTTTTSQSSRTTSTQSTTSTTSSTTATTSATSPTTTTATITSASTTQSPSTTSTRSTTPTTTSTTATIVTQSTVTVTPCPACPPTVTTTAVTTTAVPPSTTPCPVCTPTGTGTATPTPPGAGAVNCNGVQQWQASLAYTAGDRVIFNGQLFTARQWTFNNAPPAHADQWTAGGTCAQPVNNQANCNGVGVWQSTVAYTAGNRVTFNGHLWSAVQWSQSNTPGDTSGSWKDQGACA